MSRAGVVPLLLAGGIVGPVLFVAVFLVLGFVQPGYDPIKQHISELAFTRFGWVQTINFVVSGAMLVGFGLALVATRGPSRSPGAGIAAAAVGAGLVIAGVFPSGVEHLVGTIIVFVGMLVVCVVAATRLARRRRHARAAGASLAGAVVFVFFLLAGQEWLGDTYIGNFAGLMQRISVITGLGVVLVLAVAPRRAVTATAPIR